MDCKFETSGEYIPSFNGNQDLPDGEQIKIHWRASSGSEKAKMSKVGFKTIEGQQVASVDFDYSIAVKMLVTKIDNLSVKGKKITTGYELTSQNGLSQLVDEVGMWLIVKNNNMEVDQKN